MRGVVNLILPVSILIHVLFLSLRVNTPTHRQLPSSSDRCNGSMLDYRMTLPAAFKELRFGENFFYSFDDLGRLGDCRDHLFLQLFAAEVSRAVPVQKLFRLGNKLAIF
jgi:hypothetical protein